MAAFAWAVVDPELAQAAAVSPGAVAAHVGLVDLHISLEQGERVVPQDREPKRLPVPVELEEWIERHVPAERRVRGGPLWRICESAEILALYDRPTSTPEQMEHCLAMIRTPAADPERSAAVWKKHVFSQADRYEMSP